MFQNHPPKMNGTNHNLIVSTSFRMMHPTCAFLLAFDLKLRATYSVVSKWLKPQKIWMLEFLQITTNMANMAMHIIPIWISSHSIHMSIMSQGTPSLRRSPAPQRCQQQRGQQPAAAALRLPQQPTAGGQGQAQHGQPAARPNSWVNGDESWWIPTEKVQLGWQTCVFLSVKTGVLRVLRKEKKREQGKW